MPDLGPLRRAFSRIDDLTGFNPGDRIWWIYFRNAVLDLTARHRLPDLEAACAPLKDTPERVLHESRHWLALRDAARLMLEQDASE